MTKRIYPRSVLPPRREKRQRGPSEPLGSTPNTPFCAVHPLIAAFCFAGVPAAPCREKFQANSCESACGTQPSGSASFDSCRLGLCMCQVSTADVSCMVLVLKISAVHPLIAAVCFVQAWQLRTLDPLASRLKIIATVSLQGLCSVSLDSLCSILL